MSTWHAVVTETAKLSAFFRRDLLLAAHDPAVGLGGLAELGVGALLITFVDRLVDPSTLPTYAGSRSGYLEFALVGAAVTLFTCMLFERMAGAVRREHATGTWEPLLATPSARATSRAGLVAFDAVFAPVRIGVLLALAALLCGASLHGSGILPAIAVIFGLEVFICGLGLLVAHAIAPARDGIRMPMWGIVLLGIASGAFFPLALLPGVLGEIAEQSPVAIALESIRSVLIGGGGWSSLPPDAALLLPLSAAGIAAGALALRNAPGVYCP